MEIKISTERIRETMESADAFHAFMKELLEMGRAECRKEVVYDVMKKCAYGRK